MITRVRHQLGMVIATLFFLGVEALGLRSGSAGKLGLVALIFILAIALLVRVDLVRAGTGSALAAALTLTWNGWFIGPLRPGDIFVLFSLGCFALATVDGGRAPIRIPWWITQLVVAIIAVAGLNILFPADLRYLAQRTLLGATGQPVAAKLTGLAGSNAFVAFKFIVAVLAIPAVFGFAATYSTAVVRKLAVAFAVGSAISGMVAFASSLGFGQLASLVTGLGSRGGRTAGFSDQPNFLAAGLVLVAPLGLWMLVSGLKRDRIMGAFVILGVILGVYASGSRGGAVSMVGGFALSIVLIPRLRRYAPGAFLVVLVVTSAVLAVEPSFGAEILRVTRLSGGASTSGSDLVRSLVGHQGILDFHHSPVDGIGLQASFDASEVYLQELASGGLLLFLGMNIYMFGGIAAAMRLLNRSTLAAALAASLISTLVLNFFEADLTDRFYYVPSALLVALLVTLRQEDAAEQLDESAPAALPATAVPATVARVALRA